jgi:hypothetical protein
MSQPVPRNNGILNFSHIDHEQKKSEVEFQKKNKNVFKWCLSLRLKESTHQRTFGVREGVKSFSTKSSFSFSALRVFKLHIIMFNLISKKSSKDIFLSITLKHLFKIFRSYRLPFLRSQQLWLANLLYKVNERKYI